MLSEQRHQQLLFKLQNLFSRKYQMQETRRNYTDFLLQACETYEKHMKKSNDSVNRLIQGIATFGLTSNKCDDIRLYGRTMRTLCESFRRQIINNILSLRKIREDERAEIKVQQKYEELIKAEGQFYQFEKSYNKIYSVYQHKGQILNEKTKTLFEQCNNPIKYYNGESTREELNDIQSKFHKTKSLEQNLETEFQVLLQKDKYLSELMKELEERFINLYRKNMIAIMETSKVIIDINDDEVVMEADRTQNFDDLGECDMNRLEVIYSQKKKNQNSFSNELFEDFKDFFNNNLNSTSVDNEYALLQNRCITIKRKQLKNMESVLSQRKLVIKELTAQQDNIMSLEKGFQKLKRQTLSKNCSQHTSNQKRLFKRCFGKNMYEVQELTLTIIDYKNKSLGKFASIIDNNKEKLQRILTEEDVEMRDYENNMNSLLKEHKSFKTLIEGHKTINRDYQAFKNNSLDTFVVFKKRFYEVNASRKTRDQEFNSILGNLTLHLKNNCSSAQRELIAHESERYLLFEEIKLESEVINIMKDNEVFDVLFKQSFFLEYNNRFQSIVERSPYEQAKKLIEKKNENHFNARTKMKQTRSCVPCAPRQSKSPAGQQKFYCKLLQPKEGSIKGEIYIDSKYLIFQKDANIFQRNLSLFIPTADIKKIETGKLSIEKPIDILTVETPRGNLHIKSGYLNEIQEMIKPYQVVRDREDSHSFIMRGQSGNSILLKKTQLNNSTSSQQQQKMISYYDTLPTTIINIPTGIAQSLGVAKDPIADIAKLLETSQYFENFKVEDNRRVSGGFRNKYSCKQGYLKYLVREIRNIAIYEGNTVHAIFTWKISFQQLSLLKSYTYKEKIRVIYNQETPLIDFIEQQISVETKNFHKKSFINDVERMNRLLGADVAKIFMKNTQLIFSVEPTTQERQDIIDEEDDEQDLFSSLKRESDHVSRTTIPKNSREAFDFDNQKIQSGHRSQIQKVSIPESIAIVVRPPTTTN